MIYLSYLSLKFNKEDKNKVFNSFRKDLIKNKMIRIYQPCKLSSEDRNLLEELISNKEGDKSLSSIDSMTNT